MKYSLIALSAVFVFQAHANVADKSICGLTDERTPSSEPRVGKLVKKITEKSGCSASLIGKSCVVSAGHCGKSIYFMQFNEQADGKFKAEDIYTVDRKTLDYFDNGAGTDYAVFKLNKNTKTGKFAGEAQGFYKVRYSKIAVGDRISITGYGKDTESSRTFTQQIHEGSITNDFGIKIYHDIDTDSGNSGSGMILQSSDELVGVHTNGGCYAYGGANSGTSISGSAKFLTAVKKCLASDL
jgi:V8-like Glu-specific endopeptidase